jgi:hypothetical protein
MTSRDEALLVTSAKGKPKVGTTEALRVIAQGDVALAGVDSSIFREGRGEIGACWRF